MSKRISITIEDAKNILEWRLALLQGSQTTADCPECIRVQKKVEKFLGSRTTSGLKRIVKKHPYFNKVA